MGDTFLVESIHILITSGTMKDEFGALLLPNSRTACEMIINELSFTFGGQNGCNKFN